MLRYKVNEVKSNFIDRKAVIDQVGKAQAKNLMFGGGLIRKIARNSMRAAPRGKLKKIQELFVRLAHARGGKARKALLEQVRKLQHEASAPAGQPPRTVLKLLKDMLFFAFDSSSKSVVIGPAKLNRRGEDVPSILEEGGTETIRGKHSGRIKRLKIAPHPYMGPALKKAQPRLASAWADSVKT